MGKTMGGPARVYGKARLWYNEITAGDRPKQGERLRERREMTMKLILSDRSFQLPAIGEPVKLVDLSKLNIAHCVGCFGCWVKTPGKCVIRDDAVAVYPLIAQSTQILYVSRVKYGGYDAPVKTMLERAIPVQQAFLRIWQGETHHVQRRVAPKEAVILGYGAISSEEKAVFSRLAARNAKNMCFEKYRVVFAAEDELEAVVRNEVLSWQIS